MTGRELQFESTGPVAGANLAWSSKGAWSLYEFIIPINFLRSLRQTFELVQPSRPGRVVDIGAGSGLGLCAALPWLQQGGRLIEADPDESALMRAAARARKLGVLQNVGFARLKAQDVHQLGAGEFQGAFAHFSLYAIREPAERRLAVERAFELLEPGARFACAVPAEDYNRRDLVADAVQLELARTDVRRFTRWRRALINCRVLEQANKVLDEQLDRDVMHRYTRRELTEHFEAAGFVSIDVRHVPGFNAYQAVGQRGA